MHLAFNNSLRFNYSFSHFFFFFRSFVLVSMPNKHYIQHFILWLKWKVNNHLFNFFMSDSFFLSLSLSLFSPHNLHICTLLTELLSSWESLLHWSENESFVKQSQEEMAALVDKLNKIGTSQSNLDTEAAIQFAIQEAKVCKHFSLQFFFSI